MYSGTSSLKLNKTLFWVLFFFSLFSTALLFKPGKAAANQCYSPNMWVNARVHVWILDQNGQYLRNATDFRFRVQTTDPSGYFQYPPGSNYWDQSIVYGVPREGEPAGADVTIDARGDNLSTCPLGYTDGKSYAFTDPSTGNFFLNCLWGVDHKHSVGYRFTGITVNDYPDWNGVWQTSSASIQPSVTAWGTTSDLNKTSHDVVLVYKLTSRKPWNYVHSSFTASKLWSTNPATAPSYAPNTRIDIQNNIVNYSWTPGSTYNQFIQYRVGTQPWVDIVNGRTSNPGLAGTAQRQNAGYYVIPTGLANGTVICFRAYIDRFTGLPPSTVTSVGFRYVGNTSTASGTVNCVRVNNPGTLSCAIDSPLSIEPGSSANITLKLKATNFPNDAVNGNLTVSIKQGSSNLYTNTNPVTYSPKPFGSAANSVATSTPIPVNALNNTNAITVTATLPPYLTAANCGNITLKNKPYLSFYGGNVCSRGPINTYNNSATNAGSGSQLATFAIGVISGYATAKMRTTAPQPPKGLAFANESSFFGQLTNPACGDVDSSYPMISSGSTWPGFISSLTSGTYLSNTNATMAGGSVPNGVRATYYVNGNLTINGNITYANSYTSINQIPSFTVIVNGNIYIDNDVTELNGTYIARGTSGKIFTCTNGSALWGNIGPNCGNQLKVYGAFYAKDIRWLRVANSLKDASQNETYTNSKAAEVLVDGPWRYLTNSTQDSYFDAYTSLSPIL